jgi:hypothetical protein
MDRETLQQYHKRREKRNELTARDMYRDGVRSTIPIVEIQLSSLLYGFINGAHVISTQHIMTVVTGPRRDDQSISCFSVSMGYLIQKKNFFFSREAFITRREGAPAWRQVLSAICG